MTASFRLRRNPAVSSICLAVAGTLSLIAAAGACSAEEALPWQEQAAAYARIFSQVEWTPVAEGIPAHPRRPDQFFEAGTTYTGTPYSNGGHEGRIIGFEVYLKTFLAAVENPRSVVYTKDLRGQEPPPISRPASFRSAP